MIDRIIAASIKNRFLVLLALLALVLWGLWSVIQTPLDAIPDLSENQVIVFTDWPGRSPQVVEDQVTYPLVSGLQGLPDIKAVRASSAFGFSMVYVIFNDNTDIYFARTRVLERLSSLQGSFPQGVNPVIGPQGTGVGHVFWYALEAKGSDLGTLRSLQDWYLRLQLQAVPGVAEVASLGGFVREYQIDVDPRKLFTYGVSYMDVAKGIKASNGEVGGGIVERNGEEYAIRGRGYVADVRDLERVVVKTGMRGIPVTVADIGTVQLGSDLRRGLFERNGEGEVVGGIVVMRYGENAKAVIERVKARLAELGKGLPAGVKIVTAYDRSSLIERAVDTLKHSLIEEAIIVSAVILLFLLDVRSALVIVLAIPVAVLMAFIMMNLLGISSNLMSLGGVAIAIGVLVDAAIVMVENAYRHLAEGDGKGPDGKPQDFIATVTLAAQQVGRPIFFSLLIILLSFSPVFLLEGQEGKLFHPLAATKTFAMASAAILSITLVPVLITFLLRGKLKPESANPVSRFFIWLYRPVLSLALRFKKSTVALAMVCLALVIPVANSIGKEFMPPLDEGTLLFMPTMLPAINISEAKRIVQVEDRILKGFPEVESVFGKVGRAETATDPAPVSMVETIVNLKPRVQWPDPGKPSNKLIAEMDAKVRIAGVTNGWTQPIINRINMLTTGVRTDLGLKIYGPDLQVLERLAIRAEALLKMVPGAADTFAERSVGGRYISITPDRTAIARYGLTVGSVQDVLETAIGGMDLSTAIEGRRRLPIRLRFARDFRGATGDFDQIYVPTMMGPQIPLPELASIKEEDGPTMISSENGLLRAIVDLNVRGRDMGSFVDEASKLLDRDLKLPPGYTLGWSGQYENQMRANARLKILVPIVVVVVLLLLYFTFQSAMAAALVIMAVPFALIGGVLLQKFLGYNFSVAVYVGYIALTGIAVETGVVMWIYLEEALNRRLAKAPLTKADVHDATIEGAVLRLRPKLMTVAAAILGLLPILWSSGTGADVMRPIATPMIGGLVTSTVLVLVVLPVLFNLYKSWGLPLERSPVITIVPDTLLSSGQTESLAPVKKQDRP
jgi:Cu(I)/Ag(I) efflux system membrane protein CusA/SilA